MLDETALIKIMATVLDVPVENINADASMDTIENWDSLHHMSLVLALEETFGVSIPDEEAANITSYSLIKLVVNEQLQNA